MIIRKLNHDELNYINDIQRVRNLSEISEDYWNNVKDTWIIYGAFIEDKIVAISFLFPYYRIPHDDYSFGYIAELGGTYTIPEYRGMGIANKLIKEMLDNIDKDLPFLDAIVADSTDAGYSIYKQYGFKDVDSHRIWKQI